MIRQAGVTLIELMIVVLIIGLLALVASPFTSGWIDEARVNDARSQLHRAHAEAKALALRNPRDARGNQVAGCVTLSNAGELMVRENNPTGTGCGGNTVWQGKWPAGVSLTDAADSPITTIHINNRGQILSGNSPVHGGLAYTLKKGNAEYGTGEDDNRLR